VEKPLAPVATAEVAATAVQRLPLLNCCLLKVEVPPCRMDGLAEKPLVLAVTDGEAPRCRMDKLVDPPLALVVTARLAATAVHHH